MENGVWEGVFEAGAMKHGDLYKMFVQWNGGEGERIPAYATRVRQDADTKLVLHRSGAPSRPIYGMMRALFPMCGRC